MNAGVVLVGGLPGSGKSHVASHLREALEAEVLRMDEIREDYFPLDRMGRLIKYCPETTRIVYDLALERARTRILTGGWVLLDGTFLWTDARTRVRHLAHELGVPMVTVLVQAPDDVIRRRLGARVRGADHGSDAGEGVYDMMLEKIGGSSPGYGLPTAAELAPGEGLLVVETSTGLLHLDPEGEAGSRIRDILHRAMGPIAAG